VKACCLLLIILSIASSIQKNKPMKTSLVVKPTLVLIAVLLLANCSKKIEAVEGKIFKALNATETGIEFSNNLTENDSLNYFTYSYLYMGGGIATGDINNDGLLDIYFTGNLNLLHLPGH